MPARFKGDYLKPLFGDGEIVNHQEEQAAVHDWFQGDPDTIAHQLEIRGWKHFFAERYDSATAYFNLSWLVDQENPTIYVGMAFLQVVHKTGNGFEHVEMAAKGNEDELWNYGMLVAAFHGWFESSPNPAKRDYGPDFDIKELEAMFTDGTFKSYYDEDLLRVEGQYRNGKRYGEWFYYSQLDGRLFKSEVYEGDLVTTKRYKIDGAIVNAETWRDDEERGSTSKIKEVVYWQEIPGRYGEYLFVSDSGFCVYDSGFSLVLDEATPDNVIEEVNDEDGWPSWVIWKGGQRHPYKGCGPEGTRTTFYQGERKGTYVWKDCELVKVEE